MSLNGNNSMSLKERFALVSLLAIILFLPLLGLHFFDHDWGALRWSNPTEMAMLEWTGAFLNVFLFLLLIEHSKSSGRYVFAPVACGFLAMGVLNFTYALSSPGTETAAWIRFFSILLGSICFSFSIPARRWRGFDLGGALVKLALPAFLLAILAAWIPSSLKQILPRMLSSSARPTLFGSIFLIVPCAFFFFSALFWLHEYIARKRRVDFLIAVAIMVFAQMTLLMRDATTWGVLWWLWHIMWVADLLVACVYLMTLSVTRSIVWKLVFSLGLAFALTVMLASAIIQTNAEKQGLKAYMRRLHEKHKRVLLERDANFKFALFMLKAMSNDLESLRSNGDRKVLRTMVDGRSSEWRGRSKGFGVVMESGEIIAQPNKFPDSLKSIVLASLKVQPNDEGVAWSGIRFVPELRESVSLATLPFKGKNFSGRLFVIVDVSKIVAPLLSKHTIGSEALPESCVVYDLNTAEILFASFPETKFAKRNSTNSDRYKEIAMRLVASTFDMPDKGETIVATAPKKKFFISAQKAVPPGWGIVKIVDFNNFPAIKPRSRYFLIAVGMLALLCGFAVLLLLLHKQLSKPLGELIQATERLESGDFDVHIQTKDATEIGSISRAFNDMATRLKQLYSDLAAIIKARTAALEDARKADTAKTTFFQNISHELRTPLHGILSFARLGAKLDPAENAEKISKYFENIDASGERLMKMLDSVLDLAKLESGHMNFNFQRADLALALKKVGNEMKAAFDERGAKLEMRFPKNDMTAWIDSEMMARVFSNLLGNALKFSPEGSTVEVEMEKDGDRITVSVMDEGVGIPREEFNNIFDKFIQVGDGKRKGGTGLGLPICREIILAHGGMISAKNRDGKGACFTFTIPVDNRKKGAKQP